MINHDHEAKPTITADVLTITATRLEAIGADVQACVTSAVESSLLLPPKDLVEFAGELDAEADQDLDITTGAIDEVPERLLEVHKYFLLLSGGQPLRANWRLREAMAARLVAKNYADDVRRTKDGWYSLEAHQDDQTLPAAQLLARQIIRRIYNHTVDATISTTA